MRWTHLAQKLRLGSLTAALVPDLTPIITEDSHSDWKSYESYTIVTLERLSVSESVYAEFYRHKVVPQPLDRYRWTCYRNGPA